MSLFMVYRQKLYRCEATRGWENLWQNFLIFILPLRPAFRKYVENLWKFCSIAEDSEQSQVHIVLLSSSLKHLKFIVLWTQVLHLYCFLSWGWYRNECPSLTLHRFIMTDSTVNNGWCCAHSHRSCTHTAIMVKNLRHWIWDMNWPNHHFWIYFKQHFPQRRIESFIDDVCYRKGHWNVTFMNDALSTSVSIIRDEQLHDKSREK